jgi:amino acid transporter|tara:strand:- start:4122 stop:4574 length:453 start_codon:yes stop_codon:yes gene_type:complete
MDMNLDIASWYWMDFFVSMLIVGIGVALLATGIFTSYFGAGKSQKIGFALLFVGILDLVVISVFTFDAVEGIESVFDSELFTDALISGVSALSGMVIGMFVILFVLMKVDTVDDLEDLDLEDLEDLDLDEELKKLEEELNQADNSTEEKE